MVRKLNEKLSRNDINYYEKIINNRFDEDIAYIEKYTEQLKSLKSNIEGKLRALKEPQFYNDSYVNFQLELLDKCVSNLREAQSSMDNAELYAERFTDYKD